MNKASALLLLICFFGCDEKEKISVKTLKEQGYKNFGCDSLQTNNEETIETYTLIQPADYNLYMILARCNNNECEVESFLDVEVPHHFICQKYYVSDWTTEYDTEDILLAFNVERFLDIKE